MRPSITAVRRAVIAVLAVAALAVPLLAAGGAGALPLQRQTFVITLSQSGNSNQVSAYGPISGSGRDTSVSNTQDRFSLPRGSVTVNHTDVSNVQPVINFRTCIATATARGSWSLAGGSGRYRFAHGYGNFTLSIREQLRRLRNGRCDTNMNHPPVSFSGFIIATGFAATR